MSCISCTADPTAMAASPAHHDIIILGGGNSSGYCARELVANGLKPGQLCIITEEAHVAYERPALSKGYLAPTGGARLPGFHTCVGGGGERQAPEWYAEKGIMYMTGTRVSRADLTGRVLTLLNGGKVTYDKLIIATGARPVFLTEFKLPGADLGGICYLRDVADADNLVAAMAKAKEQGGKAVVIGGGYIGMEVASGLANNGLATTIVMPDEHLMGRLLTPELATVYERVYEGKGVTFLKGHTAKGFEGQHGKVSRVLVSPVGGGDTTTLIDADMVVVGVGARPNTELFTGQLELEAGGIKVDGHMAASVPNVWAMGDVAAFPLRDAAGKVSYVRQEHVTHCRLSAAQAARAALGLASPPYDYLPFFYSRIFSLGWVFYGFSTPGSTTLHYGDLAEGVKFGCLWINPASGKLDGAFLEGGTPEENAEIKKAVAARVQVGQLLPAVELAAIAAASGAPNVGGVDVRNAAGVVAYLSHLHPATAAL